MCQNLTECDYVSGQVSELCFRKAQNDRRYWREINERKLIMHQNLIDCEYSDSNIVKHLFTESYVMEIVCFLVKLLKTLSSKTYRCAESVLRPNPTQATEVYNSVYTPTNVRAVIDSSVAEVVASLFSIGAARCQGFAPAGRQTTFHMMIKLGSN